MSTASFSRRIDVWARSFDQQASEQSADPFVAAVEGFNRDKRQEQAAAVAMVAFAQALAGTVMQAPADEPEATPVAPAKRKAAQAPARREHPSPHAVYTFEEVMRMPRQSPEGCFDPFAVSVPVYPSPDDDDEEGDEKE